MPRIILVFMGVDWSLYMRRPAVEALAVAARHLGSTVIAVNRPLCPLSTPIRKPGRTLELLGRPRLHQISSALFLYSPRYVLHDTVARKIPGMMRLNMVALRRSYHHLQKRLDIWEPRPLVWFNYPEQGYVADLFEDSFSVFELYDELSDIEGRQDPATVKLEVDLRARVDLLLTTSQALQNKYGSDYRNSFVCGNGLARESFDVLGRHDTEPLASIAKLPSPRLGYAGMLSDRIDWALISRLADVEPDWQFIFAGPGASDSLKQRLKRHDNIHITGAVPQEDVPKVLKAFELGILPYRDTSFFKYLNPLKFYEMAAAGLPMVSSPIDELRRYPGSVVTVARNHEDDWRRAIHAGLKSDRSESVRRGREVAGEFIWEDMAERTLASIADLV